MDPWHELLEGGGSPEEEPSGSPLLHIARFLQQMGVLQDTTTSKLAPPASRESVERLAKEDVIKDTEVKCPICLRELGTGDVQVTMPCSHLFHDECILAWLSKTNSCPVCRHELPTADPVYEEHRLEKLRKAKAVENVRTLHESMYS